MGTISARRFEVTPKPEVPKFFADILFLKIMSPGLVAIFSDALKCLIVLVLAAMVLVQMNMDDRKVVAKRRIHM